MADPIFLDVVLLKGHIDNLPAQMPVHEKEIHLYWLMHKMMAYNGRLLFIRIIIHCRVIISIWKQYI